MVGVDRHACPQLDCVRNVHQLRLDLRDLCEDDADDAKRGTTAARTLKSLLATLQPATTSAGVKLALLVNNAAYQVVAPFSETTLKDFNEVLSTNLTAPFMLTKLLLPELTVRRVAPPLASQLTVAFRSRPRRRRAARWSWCRLSTPTSPSRASQRARPELLLSHRRRAALSKPPGSHGSHPRRRYATSKGGLKTLTNALAVELGPLGIRVNAARPAASCAPPHRIGSSRAVAFCPAGAAGRHQHADASRWLRGQPCWSVCELATLVRCGHARPFSDSTARGVV